MNYLHEKKEQIGLVALICIFTFLISLIFINVYDNDLNNERIIDYLLEANHLANVMFPLSYVLTSLVGMIGSIYVYIKRETITKYIFIYGMSLLIIIAGFFFMFGIDQTGNDLSDFPSFVYVIIAIGFGINLYLYKYADCAKEEEEDLIFRRAVLRVFHLGYFLVWIAFMAYLLEENGWTYDEIRDVIRYITATIIVFSVFVIPRAYYRSRLITTIISSLPALWMMQIFIVDSGMDIRDGGYIFYGILMIMLIPVIIINYSFVIGKLKEMGNTRYQDS